MDILISSYADFFLALVSLTGSFGLSIFALSLLSALLMLKLTKRAEKSAALEREYQSVFSPQVQELKRNFTGNVLHKALRELYERYSYHPIYAVRRVLPLFVQLPFLILTYFMLTGLPELVGQSFFVIKDLSKPDGLMSGSHLLPFLMTIANIMSALLLPNTDKKSILQAVGISLLFLVVLYEASAGILLYWTFNNLISLGKSLYFYSKRDKNERWSLKGSELRPFLPDALIFLSLVFLFLALQSYLELAAVEDSPRTYIQTTFAFLLSYGVCNVLAIILKRFSNYFWRIVFAILGLVIIVSVGTFLVISPSYLIKKIADFIFYYDLVPLYAFPLLVFACMSFTTFLFVKQNSALKSKNYIAFAVGASISALSFHWLNNSVFLFAETIPLYFLIGLSSALVFALITYPYVRSLNWNSETKEVVAAALFFSLIMLPTVHAVLIWSNAYLEYLLLITFSYLVFSFLRKQGVRIVYSFFLLFSLINVTLLIFNSEDTSLETELTGDLGVDSRLQKITNIQKQLGDPSDRPNVYFLVSESMPDLNTLKKLNIDPEPLKTLLDEFDFKTYADTYTIAPMSLPSMSQTLDVRTGISDGNEMRKIVGGYSLANLWLKDIGYQSAIVTKTFMTGIYNGYDIRKPEVSVTAGKIDYLLMLLKGIGLREFKFDIQGLKRYGHNVDYEALKHSLVKEEINTPFFMLYHGNLPGHSQNSGQCRPNETELFRERYIEAIDLMRADLELIQQYDPNAVIVIMGDHGPYLTGNCHTLNYKEPDQVTELDIRDRVGTLFSVHWPDKAKAEKFDQDIIINQDFFPVLFSYLYDNEKPLSLKLNPSIRLGGRTFEHGKIKND